MERELLLFFNSSRQGLHSTGVQEFQSISMENVETALQLPG